MAVDVQIPTLGESVSEGVIVRWIKRNGERVAADEPLFELETDKANVEIPAPSAGVVTILAQEGATVHVGDVVARIDSDGAATAKTVGPSTVPVGTAKPAPPAPVRSAEPASAPVPVRQAEPAPVADAQGLSPAVRRLVEEHQLDPGEIQGTGRGGRLTKEDVLGHLNSARKQAAARPARGPVLLPPRRPRPARGPVLLLLQMHRGRRRRTRRGRRRRARPARTSSACP